MSKSILTLIIVALTALGASAAQGSAQNEAAEADRLNAEVLKLFREGKYEEARPVAERVLELREKALGGEDLKVAYALVNLANIRLRGGGQKEAEPLLERALAVAEKRGAAETDFAADLHAQLGLIRLDEGKFREAEPYLRRALEIEEKVHGAEGRRVVPALLNLADVNFLRGRPEEAHALLGRAFDILMRPPYAKDAALAKQLKRYYCPLMGPSPAANKELSDQLWKVVWRLEEPEEVAEYEKQQKERGEREKGEGAEKKGQKRIVEGGVLSGHVVSKPVPAYPGAASQQRVGGTVVVRLLVDESGKVVNAEALCGHPLLSKAAVDAARKARFTPTTLSGTPVKVSGVITYNFILR